MSAGLRVFFSHKAENLYKKIKVQLFTENTHPFAKRLVVVPSPAMKAWLNLKLASDPTCGIAAGMEIGYVDQTLRKIIHNFPNSNQREAHLYELAILIESIVISSVEENVLLWEPVKKFICGEHKGRNSRRLTAFSLQLARLFEKYGLYGGKQLAEWGLDNTNWQEVLWKRVWEKAPHLTYAYKSIDSIHDLDIMQLEESQMEVHLFSISFLPALYHRFLSKLATVIPVNYYVLSPCQAFWSDIKSDRECHRLYSSWQKKGVSENQLAALDDFLRDRNSLLANFGRLGREMAEQLELSDCVTEELYDLPEAFSATSPYDEMLDHTIMLEEHNAPLSLLDYIHADLMLMRNPAEGEKINFSEIDKSVQVHACPSKRREVEALCNILKDIITRHKYDAEPITAGDIIVMAPDIMDYEPYIKVLFNNEGTQFDYQLMEVDLLSQSPFVKAFSELLNLASSRWDAASIIAVLESPFVQKKMKFSKDDVRKIREWTLAAGIRWGENTEHCNSILRREFCEHPLVDDNQPGTWEIGLDKLLSGLAFTNTGGEECQSLAPLEIVETTSGELLGRWIELLHSLKADLKPLQDGTLLHMEQWTGYLKSLLDAYLSIDFENKEHVESKADLLRELDKLCTAGQIALEQTFAYSSIELYLHQALQAKHVNYREGHLHAVRFCSLLPMRALPAKVVVLLGMEDSAFPRSDTYTDLDMLKGNTLADYIPLQSDFDRSLFLEAILSARNYFIMSYSQFKEGREESPSGLLTEFLAYIDSAYECNGVRAVDACFFKHPFFNFDAAYFKENSPFPSYSVKNFEAACAFYQCEKLSGFKFIPNFARNANLLTAKGISEQRLIDIKDLAKMAKNPLQAYFNNTLGMYVNEVSKRHIDTIEKFSFSNLDLHFLKEECLTTDIEQILRKIKLTGIFPSGLFKEIAEDKMRLEIVKIEELLAFLKISKKEIFTIHLAADCEELTHSSTGWRCPPLKVSGTSGQEFLLVGKIKNVTSHGMLVFKEKKFDDLIGIWPQFLAFSAVVKQFGLPLKPVLIPLKDGIIADFNGTDLHASLRNFLDYYLLALHEVSPLVPKWTKTVMGSDVRGLEKTIDSHLGRAESYFFNEYVKWCFYDLQDFPNAEEMIANWQSVAKVVYGPLEDMLRDC